jgi:teichuronic acid biosynthesis glycosyltransferase TuaC
VTNGPRILYFSSLFPSPTHPHLGPFSLRRVQALIRLGSSVRVVCPIGLTPPKRLSLHPLLAARWVKQERSIPPEATIEDVSVLFPKWIWPPKALIGGLDGHLLYWQLASKLDRIIDQFRPDAIVASWLPAVAAACLAGQRRGVPVVAIAEGSDLVVLPREYPWWSRMQHALNLAQAIVFVSEDLRSKAQGAGIQTPPTFVIYNGVDPKLFVPLKRRSPGSEAIILTVGGHVKIKDHATLLRAVALLSPRLDRPIRVVLIGDGPLRSDLVRLAEELNIRAHVDFLDARSQAELVSFYQAADVFCLPSLSEGMGCVALEAMACGTPIVASRVGGIPEIVSAETGILVPPSDPDALAAALEASLKQHWDSVAIRHHVVERFTWDRTAAQIISIVERFGVSSSPR